MGDQKLADTGFSICAVSPARTKYGNVPIAYLKSPRNSAPITKANAIFRQMNYNLWPFNIYILDHHDFILSNFKENPISLKRV